MKLRKDQRYTIYCIMLAEAQSKNKIKGEFKYLIWGSTDSGCCLMCHLLFGEYELYNYLIELNLKETLHRGEPNYKWNKFNNWAERIRAIKQCITETENF